jgi:magnesium-transporting ATPase (P-type)
VNPSDELDGQQFKALIPKLYYVGQKSTIFNWANYFAWVFTGVCHSVIVFIFPYFVYNKSILGQDGKDSDLWIFSITSFTAVIFVSLISLLLTF